MWLAVGYFDESTDQDTENMCYVVAGFIGAQLVTATLELRWRDLLKKHNIDYFKASELNAGTGQFQKFRDNPHEHRWRPFSQREKDIFREIKTDFVDLILSFDKGLYGVGAAIVLPDLERLRSESEHARKVLAIPYFLCSQMCLVAAGLEMFEQNNGVSPSEQAFLRPIFHQHEEYGGRAKHAFNSFCGKNPVSAKYLLAPLYESDRDYLALQAADDFAFEVRKLLVAQENNWPSRREPMKRLAQSGNVIRVYKLDYDALNMIAEGQSETLLPVEAPMTILRENAEVVDER